MSVIPPYIFNIRLDKQMHQCLNWSLAWSARTVLARCLCFNLVSVCLILILKTAFCIWRESWKAICFNICTQYMTWLLLKKNSNFRDVKWEPLSLIYWHAMLTHLTALCPSGGGGCWRGDRGAGCPRSPGFPEQGAGGDGTGGRQLQAAGAAPQQGWSRAQRKPRSMGQVS